MSRFYLDTMVFIEWFERSSPNQAAVDRLFTAIEEGSHELLSSLFVECELLVMPVKKRGEFSIASVRRFSNWVALASFRWIILRLRFTPSCVRGTA